MFVLHFAQTCYVLVAGKEMDMLFTEDTIKALDQLGFEWGYMCMSFEETYRGTESVQRVALTLHQTSPMHETGATEGIILLSLLLLVSHCWSLV